MATAENPGKPTTGQAQAHEQCVECGAALVDDQRYCLQCGARRGRPRIDFTAYWTPVSPTGGARASSGEDGAGDGTSSVSQPSRRSVGVLAASVLAAGILAGVALGPGPASSPAESASTLAQRALTALATQASSAPQAGPTADTTPAPNPPATPAPNGEQAQATPKKTPSTPAPTESSRSTSEPASSGPEPKQGSSSKESSESKKTAPGTPVKLPPIKHVWVISLSDTSFGEALIQTQRDPYLSKQLVPRGTLLSGYALSASSSLANGIALLSGQGVNLDTEQNCPTYTDLQPPTVNTANGLAEGVGCVYPHEVQTLADELTAGGLTWNAYVQGMESGQGAGGGSPSAPQSANAQPPVDSVTCRHPEAGTPDPNQTPTPGDPYLTVRNPFVYFHSLLDGGACATDDVDLTHLGGDLATPASTPNLSWIVPSACDDGAAAPCTPGAPGGLAAADGFLKETVPQILATDAYRKEGLVVIVPDSAPASSSSPAATKPVGALLLSPYVRSGVRVAESLNDFSLLKSLTRLFGVLPLGHANDPSAVSFGANVYGTNGKAASAASTAKKAAQAASAIQPRRRRTSHAGG